MRTQHRLERGCYKSPQTSAEISVCVCELFFQLQKCKPKISCPLLCWLGLVNYEEVNHVRQGKGTSLFWVSTTSGDSKLIPKALPAPKVGWMPCALPPSAG